MDEKYRIKVKMGEHRLCELLVHEIKSSPSPKRSLLNEEEKEAMMTPSTI